MKTKATTLLLTALLFAVSSYSQDYHRMLDNPSWTVRESFTGGYMDKGIVKQGDTVIDSKQYVVIHDSMPMGDGTIKILREDTIARKVFKRENDQDVLLFDFSLQVDDKIVLSNGYEYTVHSIDSVSVRGGIRKRLWLRHTVLGSQYWIEGVGNDEHPLLQLNPLSVTILLLCSFQDGVNVFNYGIYSSGQDTSDCKAYTTSAKVVLAENSFKIYPNPATNVLHIDFTTITPNKIEIQDIHGRTLYSQSVSPAQSTHEVSLADFASGVYFVKLYSDEWVVLKKVVRE